MPRGFYCATLFAATLILATATPVSNDGWTTAAAWTKAQWREARRKCRKAYGKRLIRTAIRRDGVIICHYNIGNPKNMTWDEANRICKRQYKEYASPIAIKRNGKWICKYWE